MPTRTASPATLLKDALKNLGQAQSRLFALKKSSSRPVSFPRGGPPDRPGAFSQTALNETIAAHRHVALALAALAKVSGGGVIGGGDISG